MATTIELQNILDLRSRLADDPACADCRYFRVHTTGADVSECLLLGRTLAISEGAIERDKTRRCCSGWAERPIAWDIHSCGVGASPFWEDPYISRERQHDLRFRVLIGELSRLRAQL